MHSWNGFPRLPPSNPAGHEQIKCNLVNLGTTAKTRGGVKNKQMITKYQKLELLLMDDSELLLAVLPRSINHDVNFE